MCAIGGEDKDFGKSVCFDVTAKAIIKADPHPDHVRMTDKKGHTALHYSADQGAPGIIHALIKADPSDDHVLYQVDGDGLTALALAEYKVKNADAAGLTETPCGRNKLEQYEHCVILLTKAKDRTKRQVFLFELNFNKGAIGFTEGGGRGGPPYNAGPNWPKGPPFKPQVLLDNGPSGKGPKHPYGNSSKWSGLVTAENTCHGH